MMYFLLSPLAKKKYFLVFLIFIISVAMLATGCSPTPVFLKPDYTKKNSFKTIAVMPVQDNRIAPERDSPTIEKINHKLADAIMDRNYDVLPAERTLSILKGKGLLKNKIDSLSAKDICDVLSVDGIMKSSLVDYDKTFLIHHKLEMWLQLYNAKGESIWIHHIESSEYPFFVLCCGILPGLIAEAITYGSYEGDQLSRYLGSLPKGQGNGEKIVRLLSKPLNSVENNYHAVIDSTYPHTQNQTIQIDSLLRAQAQWMSPEDQAEQLKTELQLTDYQIKGLVPILKKSREEIMITISDNKDNGNVVRSAMHDIRIRTNEKIIKEILTDSQVSKFNALKFDVLR